MSNTNPEYWDGELVKFLSEQAGQELSLTQNILAGIAGDYSLMEDIQVLETFYVEQVAGL